MEKSIFEQLNHYTISCPGVLDEQPHWTGILLRKTSTKMFTDHES
jgi:hypothetical protein